VPAARLLDCLRDAGVPRVGRFLESSFSIFLRMACSSPSTLVRVPQIETNNSANRKRARAPRHACSVFGAYPKRLSPSWTLAAHAESYGGYPRSVFATLLIVVKGTFVEFRVQRTHVIGKISTRNWPDSLYSPSRSPSMWTRRELRHFSSLETAGQFGTSAPLLPQSLLFLAHPFYLSTTIRASRFPSFLRIRDTDHQLRVTYNLTTIVSKGATELGISVRAHQRLERVHAAPDSSRA
jgi:hypothetical protein